MDLQSTHSMLPISIYLGANSVLFHTFLHNSARWLYYIFTFCCWLALRVAYIDANKVVVISSAASIVEILTFLGIWVKVKCSLLHSASSSNFRQFANFAVIWNVLILLTNFSFSLKVYFITSHLCSKFHTPLWMVQVQIVIIH